MHAEQFSRALGKINDKYIMDALACERKKKSGRLRWGAAAACFGLILAAALAALPGVMQGPGEIEPPPSPDPGPVASEGGRPGNAGPLPSGDPGPAPSDGGRPGNVDPMQPPEERELIINWDNVALNETAGLAADGARFYYDPALYDVQSWGTEEVRAYYGWELAPGYIPDGLTGGGNAVAGYIVREKATGEIVQEHAARSFWTAFWEDGSPKSDDDIYIPTGFTIIASRSGILHCALLPVEDSKSTSFGGVPVTLSHCSLPYGPFDPTQKAPDGLHNMPAGYYDIYTASFALNGVQYEIKADRLDLEEVIKITASVININWPYREDFTVGEEKILPDKGVSPAGCPSAVVVPGFSLDEPSPTPAP